MYLSIYLEIHNNLCSIFHIYIFIVLFSFLTTTTYKFRFNNNNNNNNSSSIIRKKRSEMYVINIISSFH